MRHLKLTAIVCAATLSALVTSAEDKVKLQADTRTTADQSATDTTCKANELIGMSLQNKSGDKLATVRDLAIDTSSGRLAYIVVASGGILGLGADYHAVPAKAISFDTANAKALSSDITKEKLESSPKFKKDQLNTLTAQREQIDQHFKDAKDTDLKAEAKIGDKKAELKVDAPEIPSPTGRADKTAELKLATDLIGKQVATKDGSDFGKLSDLLVDVKDAKVPFAIISTGTLLKPGDTRYAVALQNLQTGPKDKVTVNVDRAALEQAQPFDHEKWQASGRTSGSAGVFKYEEKGGLKVGANTDADKSDATTEIKTSGDATALSLLKEGNRYVGEQAKDKLVQMRSEKSINGLIPSVWYVVFYDPTAALKATEVKFVNGKMADVKRPLRLLEATSNRSEPLDTTKIKIDSDKALDMAKKQPSFENAKLTASEMRLERGQAGLPVWNIQFFGPKAADATDDVSLGHITLSAEDGKVLKTDLKTQ
jgi:sporulation protein YlmC with PRC-barrel domain